MMKRRSTQQCPKAVCGQMWQCDDGVDVACAWGGRRHTLRLRYCLDANRRVRLLGTGIVGGELVRIEVFARKVTTSPARYARFVRKCVDVARPTLAGSLRTYAARFPPSTRSLLDWSGVAPR